MKSLVEEVMASHRARMPRSEATACDPVYQYHWRLMRSVLALVDVVMEDEGVPVDVRRRVVRGVVYGGPNVADAEHRVDVAKLAAEAAAVSPAVMQIQGTADLMSGWPANGEVPDPSGP